MDCATACSQCGTKMGSARSFATATSICWPCYREQQMVTCDACGRSKEKETFDAKIMRHHESDGRKAVCKECVERGYSPLDVRSYQCQGLGGHTCGHKAFDTHALNNAKARSMENLLCNKCTESTLQCSGCKQELPQSSFKKDMWHHGRHNGQKSMCIQCAALGLSPRDAQRYLCGQCGKEYGHMKFDRTALKNFKRPGRTTQLCCQQCRAESTRSFAAAKVRQATLLSILRQGDAWKCTCKRIPRKQKAYHALHQQLHTDRCKLHPSSMGEKRWDGKNKGITLDDLRFLLERNAY